MPDDGVMRGYVINVHKTMVRDSTIDPGTKATDGDTIVWEGSVSAIFKELEINQGYYTPVMRVLQELECIYQLRRGSRAIKSRFAILRSPESIPEEEWPSFTSIVKSRKNPLTASRAEVILLEQRVETLEKRLGTLNVARALAELSTEIAELRQQITVQEDS